MPIVSNLYATDEDVAVRAPADFAALCPRDQKLAAGTDGFILPSALWTLRSTDTDFQVRGLMPGQIVQLTRVTGGHRSPSESLVVASVAGNAVTLRRKGQAPGVGEPPAPPAGTAGVEFLATTLTPQLAAASAELDRRFGLAGRLAPGGNLDPALVREAVVLMVLHRQYRAMPRPSADRPDPYESRAKIVEAELEAILDRLATAPGPGDPAHRGSTFTRLSR